MGGGDDEELAGILFVKAGCAVIADWNSDEAYRGLPLAGRSALAWELLRRDPDYSAAARAAASALPEAAPAAFVNRWGLHFRGGSWPRL